MIAGDCRYCRYYAWLLLGLSLLVGVISMTQYAAGLARFGGEEYAPRVLGLGAVRSLGPAVSGSSASLALVLWAQILTPVGIRAQFPAVARRVLLAALPGYLASAALICGAGALFGSWVFGVGLAQYGALLEVLGPRDLLFGAVTSLLDLALVLLLAHRLLAPLKATRRSLPAQLALAFAVTAVLRSALGYIVALVLPA